MNIFEKIANTVDFSQKQTVTALRIIFPLWSIVAMFSILYVPGKIMVSGDEVATIGNLLTYETLFRWSIFGNLLTQVLLIFAALLLYKLFKSVNKKHSLMIVVFALLGLPIDMVNNLNKFAALHIIHNPEISDSLAMLFLNLSEDGLVVASIFWGLWLLPYGWLVYKSGYFPKILGIFVIIAGIGYLLLVSLSIVVPEKEALIETVNYLTMGELIFMLWLIFKGAKLPSPEN